MPTDVRDGLRAAASTPSKDLDLRRVRRHAVRLRTRRRVGLSAIALAVVGASVFVLSQKIGTEQASVQANRPGAGAFHDERGGLTVDIPAGWTRGHLSDIAYGTGLRLRLDSTQKQGCARLRDSVSILLREVTADAVHRPRRKFGPTVGTTRQLGVDQNCHVAGPATTQQFRFADRGRAFGVFITFGGSTSNRHRNQAYAALNSLRFVRARSYDQPVSTGPMHPGPRVYPEGFIAQVLNGSGLNQAATTLSQKLRGSGVPIATPVEEAPPRTTTVVQCRAGYEREAVQLASQTGSKVVVEPLGTLPPAAEVESTCYVLLGSDRAF